MANKEFVAMQMNRFMQLQVQSANLPDEKAMEYADLYPEWEPGKKYVIDEIFKYGVNADSETQLYKVVQEHISQSDWPPGEAEAFYKKVGFTEDGVAVWTQPLCSTDAYMKDDIVSFEGQIWISIVDNNVWQPGIYGWKIQS